MSSEPGTTVKWTQTSYGWSAAFNGHRLAVQKSPSADGYVAKVNGSAKSPPTQPHATVEEAKAEAESMATDLPSLESALGLGRGF